MRYLCYVDLDHASPKYQPFFISTTLPPLSRPMSKKHSPTDHASLKQAFACFPTGVAVVTTMAGDKPTGLTVSSFNTVSLDPPLILWSLSIASFSLQHFQKGDHFAVNILSGTQASLSQHFAQTEIARFTSIDWHLSAHNLPIIEGVAAILECQTWQIHKGGDHDIIIGKVIAHQHSARPPLIYGKGKFFSQPDM